MLFLEHWLHGRIERKRGDDAEGPDSGCSGGLKGAASKDLKAFQLYRLRATLHYACRKSAFYRDRFGKEGIRPDDVRSLDDIVHLPFTEPADLAENPYRFLCVSQGEVERVYTHSTAGTTGRPKKVFFTEEDLDEITDYMATALQTVAQCGGIAGSGYVVQILLPDGRPASQAHLLATAAKKAAALPVVSDITLGTEEQIEAIERCHPAILFGATSRLVRLTLEVQHRHRLDRLGVKILFLTSEFLPGSTRKRMEEVWKSEVYLHYGMTELGMGGGVECHTHRGFHFNETDFLFEVVDPANGTPQRNGEGELVFTTLNRKGMPLIRYRTGDISRLITEPCACGASTLSRIDTVAKRVESILRIGAGDEIYPTLFADTLADICGIIDHQVVLAREGVRECLILRAETTEKEPRLRGEIRRAIRNLPVIRKNIEADRMAEPRVDLVGPGTLKRAGRTKRLIEDRR